MDFKNSQNNILLNKIDSSSLNEYIPPITQKGINILSFNEHVVWSDVIGHNDIHVSYDSSHNIIIDCSISKLDPFRNTGMYFSDERIGFGRNPLHNYKIDIATPKNTKMTALHIGDGLYGFSLGNATDVGFLPQIVGIGSDEDDAGLYFLGKTPSEQDSSTPVIIFDGRNIDDSPLKKRPILGISSGSYDKFAVTVHFDGKVNIKNSLEVDSDIIANDIILSTIEENISLLEEINDLRERISSLEEIILK